MAPDSVCLYIRMRTFAALRGADEASVRTRTAPYITKNVVEKSIPLTAVKSGFRENTHADPPETRAGAQIKKSAEVLGIPINAYLCSVDPRPASPCEFLILI